MRVTDQIDMGECTLVIEEVDLEANQERALAPFGPRDQSTPAGVP